MEQETDLDMSKYIDADKLKAEIERRMKDYNTSIEKYYNKPKSIKAERDSWKWAECKWFLNLITSLQQEQPMDIPSAGSGAMCTTPPKFKLEVKEQPASEKLEEEMDEMWLEYCEDVDYLVYASIARYFAEWGAEHLKR